MLTKFPLVQLHTDLCKTFWGHIASHVADEVTVLFCPGTHVVDDLLLCCWIKKPSLEL